MFNRRTLYFSKKWLDSDNNNFKTISDVSLTQSIIKKANYYELDIKDIYLNDLYSCKIILKGNKKLFINFVDSLLDDCGKYIEKVHFDF